MFSHIQIILPVIGLLVLAGKVSGRSPASWSRFGLLSAFVFVGLACLDSGLQPTSAGLGILGSAGLLLWWVRDRPLLSLAITFGLLFALDAASRIGASHASSIASRGETRTLVFVGFSYALFRLHDGLRSGPALRWNALLTQVFAFPTRTAGPILMRGESATRHRPFSLRSAFYRRGLWLMTLGLFKVFVVMPTFNFHFETGLLHSPAQFWRDPGNALLTGLYQYGRVYLDFSGYTDIAVGGCALLGLRVRHNFRRPFLARSLSDFWRRWHITLSYWIRKHAYLPLGGSWRSPSRVALNLTLCMILVGLWHGLRLNFLVWGLLHATGLLAERFAIMPALRAVGVASAPPVRILLWFWTQGFVTLSWLAFFA